MAGRSEPKIVQQGYLNKTTGLPQVDVASIAMTVGTIMIPNYSQIWGRRVLGKNVTPTGAQKDGKINVTDPNYKGQIEDLEWGDERGEVIEIRHLATSMSIDKQYQDQVLKLKPSDEEGFIYLLQGLNDFDPDTQKSLIQVLKIHTRNGDSKSRKPGLNEYDFINYDKSKIYSKEKDEFMLLSSATTILLPIEHSPDKIAILYEIVGVGDKKQQAEVKFREMVTMAKNETKVFVDRVQNFKTVVAKTLSDALEAEIVDVSIDGTIAAYINGKKEAAVDDVPKEYRGKGMLKYIADFILDEPVWNAYLSIKKSLEDKLNNV